MNLLMIVSYVGKILCLEALLLVPSLLVSLWHGERAAVFAFVGTALLLLAVGGILTRLRPKGRSVYNREGFAIVALSWIALSFFGALPFWFSGAIPSLLDACFETVSGFTTTGSSILTNVEAMPMGLLFWRSFIVWVGGMGVLVFFLAIAGGATRREEGSYHIVRAEAPGPTVGKLVPKMGRSAAILYLIYVVLTLVLILLLVVGGMPLFDSVTTAFATAGTGGFSVRSASLAAYDSYYLQGVVSVFMAVFGVNFSVYYLLLLGQVSKAARNEELRLYLGILAAATLAVAVNVLPLFENIWQALHHSLFQVSSIITTTGFATVDFNLWPTFSKAILLLLMVVGGSAGSTAGGIKVVRLLILGKFFRSGLQKAYYPRSVKVLRMDGKALEDDMLQGVSTYMVSYFFIMAASLLLVFLEGQSLETTLSAVLTCLNNVGPGLDLTGPTASFAPLAPLSKGVLMADMLIGRLEIFPMLLLFSPSVWRHSH